jgi:enamine deaminase RidA (YjgF/YER057c/UK114 family)
MAEGKKWRLPIKAAHDRVAGAGEYVFVGSSGDFDAAGQIRHPNDLALQIVGAIGNLREALGEKGLDLGDVVRLKGFYTPAGKNGYWEVMARLRRAFDFDLAPAITANPVPMQPFAGQAIQLLAIARKGWREQQPVIAVTRQPPKAVRDLFDRPILTQGLRAGEFFSVSGTTAADPEDGIAAPGDGTQQSHAMMQEMVRTASGLGVTLQDTVKAEGYYFGTTMEQWAAMAAIRATYFYDPGPVATVVPCHLLSPEGIVTKYELTGLRTAGNKYIPRGDAWPDKVWDWPIPVPYRQGLKLRDTIWTGGQVPFEPGRSGKPVHLGDLHAQTRYVMDLNNEIVRGLGKTPADYRLLVAYFTSKGAPAETEAFLATIASCVEGPLPPITVVPQPHMHSPGHLVEIWAVAQG